MNERIQELLAQAYKEASVPGPIEDKVTVQEKFAELIVRECFKCSDSLSKHYIENHPEKEQVLLLASIADYSNEIRKHFGIEE